MNITNFIQNWGLFNSKLSIFCWLLYCNTNSENNYFFFWGGGRRKDSNIYHDPTVHIV